MRMQPLEVDVYPAYIKAYSKRHKIPPKIVSNTPMLDTAALLENRMRNLRITVSEARYLLLRDFPTMKVKGQAHSLNCIPTSAPIIKVSGYIFRASVIDLIRPIPGAKWDIPNLKSFEKRIGEMKTYEQEPSNSVQHTQRR